MIELKLIDDMPARAAHISAALSHIAFITRYYASALCYYAIERLARFITPLRNYAISDDACHTPL